DLLTGTDDLDVIEYGFTLGAYDPAHPLVVDPTVAFAGYVGGNAIDSINAVAVDGSGAVYATGTTGSADCTFEPTVGAADGVLNGGADAFVVKVNPAGTSVVYKTYLGGD